MPTWFGDSAAKILRELASILDRVATYQDHVYVVGDFNIRLERPDDLYTGTRKFDSGLGQILHDELHCLDVPDRMFFKLAVTVHRCLNGRTPPYLSDYCVPVASADTRRHLRSANRQLLAVPRYRLNTYGRRTFSVAGPTVRNSLPDFIADPTISADCFRRLLKTYLFARY